MTPLTVYEFTTGGSLILQAVMLIAALVAYGYIEDKRSWKWFIMGSLLILVRRVMALYSVVSDYNTIDEQSGLTAVISVIFLIYVWQRCKTGKRNSVGL
jgi:hypothetical protein